MISCGASSLNVGGGRRPYNELPSELNPLLKPIFLRLTEGE